MYEVAKIITVLCMHMYLQIFIAEQVLVEENHGDGDKPVVDD